MFWFDIVSISLLFITGANGRAINLVTNYFKMEVAPSYILYQYHVDFAPEIMNKGMRCSMVKEHKELLGPIRAFDGAQLFLPFKLPNDVSIFQEAFYVDTLLN